jgi:hypothetical protein
MADARDLKSREENSSCGFESRLAQFGSPLCKKVNQTAKTLDFLGRTSVISRTVVAKREKFRTREGSRGQNAKLGRRKLISEGVFYGCPLDCGRAEEGVFGGVWAKKAQKYNIFH